MKELKHQYAQQFFDLSLDMFCVANFEGYFIELNPAWERILGWTVKELCSKPFVEFVHPEDREATRSEAAKLAIGHQVIQFQNRYAHKDGTWKNLSWRGMADEKAGLIFAVARDITQQEAERARATHASKLAALGEMASGIAHEINNPLAIILAKSEQLREKAKTGKVTAEQIRDSLGIIENTAMRIAKVVKGLGTFSRSSEADPFEKVGLDIIIQDTLSLCRAKFQSLGIDIRLKNVTSSEIACRPAQISQVILNLLNNAKDAIAGLTEKWIELEVTDKGDRVVLTVTDSGNGIRPEITTRLMEPFFTTKTAGQGTGLGLSISKGIIDEHKGHFFYNERSPNTQFVVEIPKK